VCDILPRYSFLEKTAKQINTFKMEKLKHHRTEPPPNIL
jgi:hypothetical protein